MKCSTSCDNPLTPGDSWPNYLIANGNDITYTHAVCQSSKFDCTPSSPAYWQIQNVGDIYMKDGIRKLDPQKYDPTGTHTNSG